MNVQKQIDSYIAGHPEPKRTDLQSLHQLILGVSPDCGLRFLDGKTDTGKVVSNPSIGYGTQVLRYAGGKTREFYRVGLSANTAGISIYIMGIQDRAYLPKTFGRALAPAKVTASCITFKALSDIPIAPLEAALRAGFQHLDQATGPDQS